MLQELPQTVSGGMRYTTKNDAHNALDVAVALDEDVTRFGIISMLRQLPVVRTVLAVSSLDEASTRLGSARPHIVLLSCSDPRDQVDQPARSALRIRAKILMLVDSSDPKCIGQAIAAAPDGFLLRPKLTLQVLEDTLVRLARGGELLLPAAIADELMRRAGTNRPVHAPPVSAHLTPREQQTLDLLSEGCSNKQIARRLGISDNSTKRHVANVLAKLNCPNRTSAVVHMMQARMAVGT